MKRIFLAAGLIVAGFILATSLRGRFPSVASMSGIGASDGRGYTEPTVVKGAGLLPDETNNIDVYSAAHLATVNITSTVYRQNWFLEMYPAPQSGSGFVVDKNGRILTNLHVVSGRAQRIQVTLHDGSKYDATVLARDPVNDLALIKINPRGTLNVLPLGDSEKLKVGQKVLAIGNPFGLSGTLTTGIVSSLNRDIAADESGRKLEGMIQTDAAINPGNSGGPLLDSAGNVIGINTAIYGPGGSIGIGFAMPVNRAKIMLDEFQSTGKFGRPVLGVDVVFINGDLAEELSLPRSGGLLIQGIAPGSAAEAAGLRGPRRVVVIGNYQLGIGGDLITAIDGEPVGQVDALRKTLNRKRPGDSMDLSIVRDGRKMNIKARLGEAESTL